jgi:hypothetical protein
VCVCKMMLFLQILLCSANVTSHAQQYCIHYLSQLLLVRGDDNEVAAKLIRIYIGLFRALVSGKQENHKLMTCLLAGINRAYPYAHSTLLLLFVLFKTLFITLFQIRKCLLNRSTRCTVLLRPHHLLPPYKRCRCYCTCSGDFYNFLFL